MIVLVPPPLSKTTVMRRDFTILLKWSTKTGETIGLFDYR